MSQGIYELVALGARYFFAGLMLLIVLRAWRITLVDSRRASVLRRLSPETGIVGELVVLEGGERAKDGMRYPVIHEGMIGASRRADIRVRHSSVRRRHAYFQYADQRLTVRSHAGAPLRDERDRPVSELVLEDGASLSIGRVRLLLVLSDTPAAMPHHLRRHPDRPDPADPFFDTKEPFDARPNRRRRKRRADKFPDSDAYFNFDDFDDD